MKRHIVVALIGMLLLTSGASDGHAQARRVKMKIDGYLCGN